MRIFFFFLILMLNNIAFAQMLTDSTSNLYVGISLGDAQLNITNSNGTYGRGQHLPKISGEVGYAFSPKNTKNIFFVPSLGVSYQELSLLKISDYNRSYNDKLAIFDIQLQSMLHMGGPNLMIFGGAVFRFPTYSRFDIRTLTGDGTYKWITLNKALRAEELYVAAKFGMKLNIGSAQLGVSFTTSKTNFLKSKGYTYAIDSLKFITLEGTLYLPIKLFK